MPDAQWVVPSGTCATPWIRLFCFPFAGAGSLLFAAWPKYFSPLGIDVCAVALPGRDARSAEPLETDIHLLAERVVQGLGPYLDRPFALFGHSMGALLAYEVARRMRDHAPVLVIASSCRAPHHPDPEPFVHLLPVADVIAELARYGGTHDDVLANPELVELTLPLIRADAQLTEAYDLVEAPPLSCPILAIAASNDHLVARDHVASWERYTSAGFKMVVVDGDHFVVRTARTKITSVVAEELLPLRGQLSRADVRGA
jgi:medium-chain acyl-[acyl-carrier-protein] hydrolase